MNDLFDLKKGKSKYYDKPQIFYVVRDNSNAPRITIKKTYAVWRRKTKNKVWFQSKYNKGTSTFDFSYTMDQLANTLEDALRISKIFKIKRSEENIISYRQRADVLEEKLKDSNNFSATIDEEYLKSWGAASAKFERLSL